MHHKGKVGKPPDKIRMVLTRLQEVGLRVNACKISFCTIEMEYLRCILMRNGVKPQPKKVQVILAITLPKQVKDLCRFWAWSSTIKIFGQDATKCLPRSPHW